MTFKDESYLRHEAGFKEHLTDPEYQRQSVSWFDKTTADYWRHARMYQAADCLSHNKDAGWLTIGDGRFGLDAIRLKEKGLEHVLPTDISNDLLAESKRRGLIDDYRVENAEHLSFPDDSFDFVFCKESYHHFPRPMRALYEMLRVAKEAVILIEPNDVIGSPVARLKFLVNRAIGRKRHYDQKGYEVSGNYGYSISEREMEKVALGLDLPQVAFKGLNDFYIPGCEYEPADLLRSSMYRKIRIHVAVKDALCAIGADRPLLLMACIFKVKMDEEAKGRFVDYGWKVVDLPRNPYITR